MSPGRGACFGGVRLFLPGDSLTLFLVAAVVNSGGGGGGGDDDDGRDWLFL